VQAAGGCQRDNVDSSFTVAHQVDRGTGSVPCSPPVIQLGVAFTWTGASTEMTPDPSDEPRAHASDTVVDAPADPLAPLVARLAVELGPGPSWTSVEGSMLSADISGFTALSEKLAGKGKAGAEEITELVNRCFTVLIDAAYDYGGEVLKFGGDALLVLFRGEDDQRRAVDAGLAMQRALHASSAAKSSRLTMTVGVAEGPFDAFMAGSDYRELLITGPRATEVIRLEGDAAKGDTLVSVAIATALPREMLVREESGGWVVTGSTGTEPPGPRPRPLDDDLTPYVPESVREQHAAFAGLGGEHRLVTVGFLMVGGVHRLIDERGTDGVAAAFHHLVDEVSTVCAEFDVTLLHTDIAPDGVKFVLCAGAPVNPGDTGDAMLQASIRIAAIDSPLELRQGVQTGRVFAGFLGTHHRRAYTLMGDPVNTAARMLGKADDRDVVAVGTVIDGTRTIFTTDELEPFHVKGKTEPIVAHKVRSASDTVRRDSSNLPLAGRRHELEILSHAIGSLGRVVEVSGGAGVGKSRLLDAAWDAAEGIQIFQAACTPYGIGSPYSVFRYLLRGATGIDPNSAAEAAGGHIRTIIERTAPELLPRLPLLAVPFGARVDPTPEADAIAPDQRRAQIHRVVTEFLDATLTGPILLVVEDVHWIDDASGELLNHLATIAADRPWAALVTRRPEGDWSLTTGDHIDRLELDPLDDAAIRDLAVGSSPTPLADPDVDVIVDRAAGNPLFAIELARSLAENDDVPDSVEQIISLRIDRLDPAVRRLVRTAAVLGIRFNEVVVRSMMAVDGTDDADVAAALEQAERSGTVGRRNGRTWAFHHALYRDTAYEGLPYSRRRVLHRRAAEIIERLATDIDAVAPLLSLHYSAARSHELAWRYSIRAGEVATAQTATQEAATAYERALDAGRYCRSITPTDRSRVAERLGDQYYLLGKFGDAERSYRRARHNAADDPIATTHLIRKLADVYERRGESDRAIRWYRRARAQVPARTNRKAWLIARARAALGEAAIRSRRGDGDVCLDLSRHALTDAERSGSEPTIAVALERIHLSLLMLRRPDDDRAGPRAVEAHREIGDQAGMARALINLGIEAFYADRWTEASECYLQANAAAERAGTIVLAATAAINSAEILSNQGHWDRAVQLFADANRNYEAVGYPAGIGAATLFSAVALMRRGDLELADESFAAARARLTELGMTEWIDDLDTRRLELDLLAGRADPAAAQELLTHFGDEHPFRVRVLRALGLIRAEKSDPDGASVAFETALELAPDGFERALTLAAIATAIPDGAAEYRAESELIFAGLEVRSPPPMTTADLSAGTSPARSTRPQARC
jgi:class 3 adenylate cyclase/tetratricopeptide (TPR) repeat protein